MRLLCPDCRGQLNPVALECPRGHRFRHHDGVLVLLEAGFHQRLRAFTDRLTAIRAAEGRRITEPSVYEDLPFAAAAAGELEWRLRRYDLAVLSRLLRPGRPRRVLDVGAWNGWLSHRLAQGGHEVTAIDYFIDEHDGLGARRFYSTSWHAIQMDLSDLSLLDDSWDVVIVNRCLQFFTDPAGFVAAAKEKVGDGGLLVLTGLQFFRDPAAKAREVERLRRHYRDSYDFVLFLRPTKGYLDGHDRAALRGLGVKLRPYPTLLPANLRSWIVRTRPSHAFGVWVREPA
jgi:SAM-dependent methyltransferase